MKKILLLGGSEYLLPYIKAAHDMGAYVITCDYIPDNVAHHYSDQYINESIVEKDLVLKKAKELRIDGIMSPATDPGVLTAAYVAEKMGLPGCPYKSVDILQHKDKFRKFLKDNSFNVPMYEGFCNKEDAFRKSEKIKMPFIVKPVDSAGSKGVSRVDDTSQLASAIDGAFKASISGHIIIEDFIEQDGFSSDTDSFSVNSDLVFCSFNCQYFDGEAFNPYTPSAYSWPSDMPESIQNGLRSEIQRLISLLDLGTAQYNIETRMGKDGKGYIMELAPRAGGNRLSELLKMACGQDLITNAVKSALGMTPDNLHDPVYDGIWAEYIIHSNVSGIYRGITIDRDFERQYVKSMDCWICPGDYVYEFTGANRAIGTITLRFDSQSEAENKLKDIDSYVRVDLE